MNCPSHVDPIIPDGYNQNPDALNADATTRADMNHVANARLRQDHRIDPAALPIVLERILERNGETEEERTRQEKGRGEGGVVGGGGGGAVGKRNIAVKAGSGDTSDVATGCDGKRGRYANWRIVDGCKKLGTILRKYVKFVGPGFMVAVAYIDPGSPPPPIYTTAILMP